MSRARLLDAEVLESFPAFCERFGISLYPWQTEAFGRACERADGRFRYRLAGVSAPRGNGKSFAGAAVGLWRLVCAPPPADLISVALDLDGARVVLAHAKAIIRANPRLAATIEPQANGLLVPSTGSRWTISSAEHTSSRGRHPDLVLYDECGWARDAELFASLCAGQASVDDPLMLVVSTVGRRQQGPLWQVKMLADGGDPGVYWFHTSENPSPKVTADFLERQRAILMPAQFAREHQNCWVDAADSFTTADAIDRAMSTGWIEQRDGLAVGEYEVAVDIGLTSDPSAIAVGHRDGDVVYIDALQTYQGTKARPVQIQTLEDALLDLAARFPLARIAVESWQGAAVAQSLQRLGLPVELVHPTPKLLAEEWPQLAQRLATGSLVLFPHARLREELLGLTVEVGPTGARVTDRGRVHQDHATVVRMLCASLGRAGAGIGVTGGNLASSPTKRVLDGDTPPEYWPSALEVAAGFGDIPEDRFGIMSGFRHDRRFPW